MNQEIIDQNSEQALFIIPEQRILIDLDYFLENLEQDYYFGRDPLSVEALIARLEDSDMIREQLRDEVKITGAVLQKSNMEVVAAAFNAKLAKEWVEDDAEDAADRAEEQKNKLPNLKTNLRLALEKIEWLEQEIKDLEK